MTQKKTLLSVKQFVLYTFKAGVRGKIRSALFRKVFTVLMLKGVMYFKRKQKHCTPIPFCLSAAENKNEIFE